MDEKRKLLGNFEKILKFFDENSIENLNFFIFYFYFFENLLLKIEPSEITPFFYNKFFGFGGGGNFPLPPWLRPCGYVLYDNFHIRNKITIFHIVFLINRYILIIWPIQRIYIYRIYITRYSLPKAHNYDAMYLGFFSINTYDFWI